MVNVDTEALDEFLNATGFKGGGGKKGQDPKVKKANDEVGNFLSCVHCTTYFIFHILILSIRVLILYTPSQWLLTGISPFRFTYVVVNLNSHS